MAVKEIKKNIFSVGTIDWDRRLFDELIPLPDGTTYNAYLIKGSQKTALIDTVDPAKENELIDNLKTMNIDKIEYVISNHAEQDHSGTIPKILEVYTGAKVVTNNKCKTMLMDMFHIPEEKFITVNDGDTVSLGDKTLQFVFAPWVHWPETMLTYLKEDKILFESAKRYYAEIMMPFRNNIKRNLEKVKELEIDIIAPSHGPIHSEPQFIIDAYRDWVSDDVKNEVIVPYVSMHGSTQKMVDHLVNTLIDRGITVKPFNLTQTDIGELAMAMVDAATVVIGSPTVLTGAHPSVVYAAYLANALRPKLRFASLIGSYGWGGRMAEIITGMLQNLKVEIITPVIIKGSPKKGDLQALDNLANEILEKHKKVGIA
ncbi:MAG: MBL fold hydrolase [Candidatus Cloacimonas sp. 4484_209]|nr:MAG: MBL fold hydrolase [Candidatus Cloacimonas sp. 4484_209]